MIDAEAIIINCSTRELSLLALASALRHASLPVTMIDCESTDRSVPFFRRIAETLPFELRQMPLARHGDTLDRLFRETKRDALLLIDSDAEILRSDLVPAMIEGLGERAYGSGFLHAGQWLGANHLVEGEIGYYAPRMWIPCTLLRVAPVRAALAAGASFRDRLVGNELPRLPRLAWLLAQRFRVPGLRAITLDALRPLRREYFGVRPNYLFFDTGAAMHRYLVDTTRLSFAALSDDMWATGVRHEHGITRRQLRRGMRNAADVERARAAAIERVKSEYGLTLPD